MVRVAVCRKCNSTTSEVWKARTTCMECGSPIDHLDVSTGSLDRLPRILNMAGIAFAIFAVLYLLFGIAFMDMGRKDGINIIVIFLAGTLLFLTSLMLQLYLSTRAREKIETGQEPGRQRHLRRESGDEPVRSGPIGPPSRKASKLPIDRK
ncbi:MAG: hypothetical protein JW939_06515 [Candidatus Thermoplasmatota archaeon]|nr:hypothetical protein [Candidatus Thermoplasmatota archaeon]